MADKIIFEVVATAKGVKLVQQQTDKLAKSSDKANQSTKKLDKSRDAYNRREKGAANISSNATKNFSKMQQGIDGGGGSGGLVRAYALLAANVFALTAAFGVLSRSAQIDTLTQSMEVLSTTGGVYIKNVAKEMQAASGFAIDLAQGFRQVSLAASAGLSTTEIEGLTKVAKGAAISLGRNLPDAMDRIFRGAIKLEPEILDEIGLFVRVDEAAQKYARNNGKVVSALTQVEKRQGFLNEILEQGTRKFSEYADEIKPDPYVRLGAALQDIAQSGISMVNKVLGPLLSFLAEAKGLLGAVFGLLVFSLVKKAIPALGQFNAKLAQNATQAAQNARDYTAGIKQTTSDQIQEDNKKIQSTINRLEKERKVTGVGKGRPGQSPKAVAANKALKTELNGQKRLNLLKTKEVELEKQILGAGKTQQKLLREDLADMRVELSNLERQEKLTAKIAANTKKGQIDPRKGSVMQRRQTKLDQKASSTTILAGVSGKAESQGMSEGFKQLNKDVGKSGKSLGRFGKAATYAKGTVSILGTGLSRLMMFLGPVMMIIGFVTPLLIGLGKAMGLSSTESKALSESVTKLDEAFENIEKRFGAQAKGMNDISLSYRGNLSAGIAFHKNLSETANGIVELTTEFETFMRMASPFAQWWESAKEWFGFGREGKVAQLALEGTRESLRGLILAGEDSFVQLFDDAGVSTTKYAAALDKLTEAEKASTAMIEHHGDALKEYAVTSRLANDMAFAFNISNKTQAETMAFFTRELIDSEPGYLKYLTTQIKLKFASKEVQEEYRKLNPTQAESVEIMKAAKEKSEILGKAMQNLQSAIKGAQESVGKFNQAMMPKTKVDDILGSFNSIREKIRELEEIDPSKIAGLFTGFADNDNPLKGLFKDMFEDIESQDAEGNKIITSTLKDSITPEAIKTALKTVQQEFKKYRVTIIKAKAEVKALKQEEKAWAKGAAGGRAAITKQQIAVTGQAQKQFEVAEKLTDITTRNIGFSRKEFAVKKKAFDLITDEKEQEQWLTDNKITRIDFLSVEGQMLEEAIKNRERLIAIGTQEFRIDKQAAEEAMKALAAEKALIDLKRTRLKLNLELASARRGGDVSPVDNARQTIAAAKEAFEFEKSSATLKMDILTAEHEILKVRMKLLFLEAGMATKAEDGTITLNKPAQDMMDTIGKGFAAKSSAIGVGLENAALRFGITTANAIGDSFKAGSGSGILGAIRGASAAVAATGPEGKINTGQKDIEGNDIIIEGLTRQEAAVQVLKSSYQELIETMGEMGPAGAVVAGVAQGSLTIMTGMENQIAAHKAVGKALDEDGNKLSAADQAYARTAANVEMAGSVIAGVGQMLAANSKGQIMEIDQQIDAEKKRDGKSKESLAKIKQMEAKKEAMQRKAFDQNKKVQMAVTIANTAASIMAALSAPPIGLGPTLGMPMAMMAGAMGALQLAVISKTKYQGGSGSIEKPKMTALSIGKRENKVDVSRGASGGEMAYMRGTRGTGNANNFTPAGGAYGMKSYSTGGEGILVGEQGPEVVTPTQPVDVLAASAGGGAQNVNFTINTIDSQGVEQFLSTNQGAIISTIRGSANGYGTPFLEEIDTDVVSADPYPKG